MTLPSHLPEKLHSVAVSLTAEFAGIHPQEKVESCLIVHYEELARTARVHDYLAIFAERLAHDSLSAAPDGTWLRGRRISGQHRRTPGAGEPATASDQPSAPVETPVPGTTETASV